MLGHQQYTPLMVQSIVRLGSWLPFAQAAEAVRYFCQVTLSPSTVRRITEGAGAAQVAYQAQVAEPCDQEAAPALQLLTLDGAFVPLVGGEWREVKTLTLGVVGEPVVEGGQTVVHTTALSYFSRLAEVTPFGEAAQAELRQRPWGRTVCAVSDGARWIQGLVDQWHPTAVRILDFPHALGYVAQAGQALYGLDTPAFHAWFGPQRHRLLSGRASQVVDALQHLSLAAHDQNAAEQVQATIDESWHYLRTRLPMIQYAAFQALGYPIGSGAGESANKLIVERRLKGAGMHWHARNVNPLLALTNLTANQRWRTTWPNLIAFRSHQAWQARLKRRAERAPPPASLEPALGPPEPVPAPKPPPRPAEDHPWRCAAVGRARYQKKAIA